MSIGVNSGNGKSWLRYCMTCHMLGLAAGMLHQHHSHFGALDPLPQEVIPLSNNQSPSLPTGACHYSSYAQWVTSRTNMPKAKTSVKGEALPFRTSSGARYSMVPTSSAYLKRLRTNRKTTKEQLSAIPCAEKLLELYEVGLVAEQCRKEEWVRSC
uniref:Uncharacterized protein n=1 Tax=Oryza punctata TaxID=4537 RepID=A0A0E0LGU2_ORYPU